MDNSTYDPAFYRQYLQTAEWHDLTDNVKRKFGYRCQVCNRHERDTILDGHHRDYQRLGREYPEDITILCRDCHELFHKYDKLAKAGSRDLLVSRDPVTIREAMSDYLDRIEDKSDEGQSNSMLKTGYEDLDHVIGGLEKSSLITIAARPGMGKSGLMYAIALFVAESLGNRVAIFGLHSSTEQLGLRLISMMARIEYSRLILGQLDDHEVEVVSEVTRQLGDSPLHVDDTPGLTPMDVRRKCHRLWTNHGLDLVIIDGLSLMEPTSLRKSPVQELSEIARSLKRLARELNIPVLVSHHLGPTVENRNDKRPALSDLLGAGNLEQFSDLIMLIYRDDYYSHDESDRPHMAEINVAKNRRGLTAVIDLYWQHQLSMFHSIRRQEISL